MKSKMNGTFEKWANQIESNATIGALDNDIKQILEKVWVSFYQWNVSKFQFHNTNCGFLHCFFFLTRRWNLTRKIRRKKSTKKCFNILKSQRIIVCPHLISVAPHTTNPQRFITIKWMKKQTWQNKQQASLKQLSTKFMNHVKKKLLKWYACPKIQQISTLPHFLMNRNFNCFMFSKFFCFTTTTKNQLTDECKTNSSLTDIHRIIKPILEKFMNKDSLKFKPTNSNSNAKKDDEGSNIWEILGFGLLAVILISIVIAIICYWKGNFASYNFAWMVFQLLFA